MSSADLASGILKVRDLQVSRGLNTLIQNLSFTLSPGDLIWISGTNGIGKTSLLKCIAGLLKPDSGSISWEAERSRLPDSPAIFQGHNDGHKPNLSVRENLKFWREYYNSAADITSLLKKVELDGLGNLEAKNLSAGQSRRLVFARILLRNAPLWILDEPTAALDADGCALVFDLVREHLYNSGSVLMASHGTPGRLGHNARHLVLKETVRASA